MIRSIACLVGLALLVAGCKGSREDQEKTQESKGALEAGVDAGAPAASTSERGPNEPANALGIPAASVRAAVNPGNLPIYSGPTASIEGTVTVTGDPPKDIQRLDFARCPEGKAVYEKTFREGPPNEGGARSLADALVVITGYSGYIVAERHAKKQIGIERCAFSARTVDLTLGQALEVKNHDKDMHAPEITNHVMPALMVATPGGDPVTLLPDKPGFTQVIDKMGPVWLVADVYVLLHPLHATTDREGHYRIDGIPTEDAEHHPISGLEVSVLHRAIGVQTTKPITNLTPNVVERIDLQIDNHPTDAGAKPQPPKNSQPALH